ncbi:hypothetical protein [Yinghuangia soli]|uniref:Uncharacterized protein n=1 Tax=Yinghuangia soli TaxID=2908204 RepID=A0AA41Q8N1_9ACTN|nr:hypothetical protein [Yinghuangia soli]MCF2532389.1 hypothetical protein [Yinghuangia soli]
MITDDRRPLKLAVDRLQAAAAARASGDFADAVNAVLAALPQSDRRDASDAVPRLAKLLPDTPVWLQGMVAVITGACVELGADPAVCAPVILDSARDAVRRAAEFPAIWAAAGGGALPVPQSVDPSAEAIDQLGGASAGEEALLGLMAWWQVQQWELATVAMLSHRPIRDGLAERAQFRAEAERLALVGPYPLESMRHIVRMVDDEPMLVLHRPSGTAYRMRMGGLGDNRQLLTLLADTLVGGGHVPGVAPHPAAVGLARDTPFGPGTNPPSANVSAQFALANPDGTLIDPEGCPDDITFTDGIRFLVLDAPRTPLTWTAGRLFPVVSGSLVLDAVLSPEESRTWAAKASH